MRIEEDVKLDYSDVLIKPKRSTLGSRKEVKLERHYAFKNAEMNFYDIPIMASNMDGVGTLSMAKKFWELNLFTCLTKTITPDQYLEHIQEYSADKVAYTIGIKDEDIEKVKYINKSIDKSSMFSFYICIDVANGYSQRFIEVVKKVKEENKELVVIAGNVVTADQTQELILSGADIVKIGIGPGSVCTTRTQTGVGYPQLSAVIECADAAHGLGGLIIADGGCSCPGDVAKAFAAGADFVMLGGMLAGHTESEAPIIEKEGKKYVEFYGSSSKTANDKNFGGLKDYRSSEGRTVLVPYKGDVEHTIQDILGGLRSSLTYVGANKLKDFSKCTTFIKVNNQINRIFESNTIGN